MPPLGLTMLVASIGFADSINPSTVVPALYLASTPRGRGLASFALGVFVVYLTGGLVLVLGPGPALIGALHDAGPSLRHIGETVFGLAVAVAAVLLWRSAGGDEQRPLPAARPLTAFTLGAGIMAVELPTAFPYFAALSAILDSGAATVAQVGLVVAYNAVFVLPLVAVALLRSRLEGHIATAAGWLSRFGGRALAVVLAIIGALLLVNGIGGLVTA